MESLAPLPAPGLAVYPNYIARTTEVISLTKGAMSKTWEVRTTSDGTLLMTIEETTISLSHRMTVRDAAGEKLGDIRRESFSMHTTYYYEAREDGPRLWEMRSHFGFSGSRNEFNFNNAAAAGEPATQLDFKNNAWSNTGYVKFQGQDVAVMKKVLHLAKSEYSLTVTAGLDIFLIVGIILSIDDKARTAKNRANMAGSINTVN